MSQNWFNYGLWLLLMHGHLTILTSYMLLVWSIAVHSGTQVLSNKIIQVSYMWEKLLSAHAKNSATRLIKIKRRPQNVIAD